jgi:stearoyl-CoA desaturase (delta-9 desaturase)
VHRAALAHEKGSPVTSYTLAPDEKIDKLTSVPFFLIHLLALCAFFFPVKLSYVLTCVALYYVRMWGITAGYHRYFSHRAYKTNRAFQFVLAVVGCTAAQKGPLWWAAHHRHHHRYSDLPEDIHSPKRGFFWSHVGWILCPKYNETRFEAIKDFAKFPELRWLNQYYLVPPTILGVTVWLIGGWPLLFWGFFLSTVLLWHGTFTINSLSHVFGSRRYQTTDTSRNNWFLALLTCGEGWHNNHHYYQNTANQGWFWWEVDASYYVLKMLSWFRVVTDLRVPNERVKYAFKKVPSTASKVAEEALARVQDAGEKVQETVNDLISSTNPPASALE